MTLEQENALGELTTLANAIKPITLTVDVGDNNDNVRRLPTYPQNAYGSTSLEIAKLAQEYLGNFQKISEKLAHSREQSSIAELHSQQKGMIEKLSNCFDQRVPVEQLASLLNATQENYDWNGILHMSQEDSPDVAMSVNGTLEITLGNNIQKELEQAILEKLNNTHYDFTNEQDIKKYEDDKNYYIGDFQDRCRVKQSRFALLVA